MRTERNWQVGIVCVVLMALLAPSAVALDVCGQPFLIVDGEPDPVDIDCETGYTIVSNSTVNLLPGAHISEAIGGGPGTGILTVNFGADNIINIYGGQIDTMLNTASTDTVTVYGSDFAVDGVLLDPAQDTIVNTGGGALTFTLSGLYQDGSACSIPCVLESDGVINLGLPQTAPEIEVYPALLEHDFGDVAVGEPQTYVVQILNVGTADLEVTSLGLDTAGSVDFVISGAPEVPFVVTPSLSISVDIEITYTPSLEGYVSTTLNIGSNDEDESLVEVAFGGVGIVVELPPEQQIQAILDFIDASVEDGTMVAYGPGNRPGRRLRALKHMVRSAGRLIDAGYSNWAVCVLRCVDRKTDGKRRPPDFVVGEAVPTLNTMVNDLIADLAL